MLLSMNSQVGNPVRKENVSNSGRAAAVAGTFPQSFHLLKNTNKLSYNHKSSIYLCHSNQFRHRHCLPLSNFP